MANDRASIVADGYGLLSSRCGSIGFGGQPRESSGGRQAPVMIPGGRNAPELCMLPQDMDPEAPGPGWGQLKVDGIHSLHIDRRLVTREGVPMDCALHCLPALRRLEEAFDQPMVFDGEYAEDDGFDATSSAFRRGRGAGVFWLYDAVPFDEWVRDECQGPIEQRLHALRCRLHVANSEDVGMLESTPLLVPAQVEHFARTAWSRGHEGIVTKAMRSRYLRRKSSLWLRWKETVTVDCTVMDVLVKDGLLKGIMVRGPHGPLTVTAGFSEADKRALLADGAERLVEVAFNRKAGSTKPRHARFVRIRRDREEALNGKRTR